MNNYAVFIVNLLQDVNIIRPLIFLTSNDLKLNTIILVSADFLKRDKSKIWLRELQEISNSTNCPIVKFDSTLSAIEHLQNRSGYLIAASESNLSAHTVTHNIFNATHTGFLRITLQHGLECVGFIQSLQHDIAHGKTVSFGADILCGWLIPNKMKSMLAHQRQKLYPTGPTSVLQLNTASTVKKNIGGIVCENLHSVRLSASADLKTPFINTFEAFCTTLNKTGQRVTLRPHPGGQYALKNDIHIPNNVQINNNPIYKLTLPDFSYAISAPSSVLIDFILAGIPTAVWRDANNIIDADIYSDLTQISSVTDWIKFSEEAVKMPNKFRAIQAKYLKKLSLIYQPETVYKNFYDLFQSLSKPLRQNTDNTNNIERIVYIANNYLPTLQLSFIKPLNPLISQGLISTKFISEKNLTSMANQCLSDQSLNKYLEYQLSTFNPTLIIFCRYSGPFTEIILHIARNKSIPIIFHIDDDLLNISVEAVGDEKYRFHNQPNRLNAIKNLLNHSSLVYCSTEKLAKKLKSYKFGSPIYPGDIYCASSILNLPKNKQARIIGYMGYGHKEDLNLVLPTIIKVLENYKEIYFHLFGTIELPDKLKPFNERIITTPPIRDYKKFLYEFSKLNWDIGICPLVKSDFNLCKANTKWVEYSALGVAVIASKGTVYDNCCSDNCGILADTQNDWYGAFELLINRPDQRYKLVLNAQKKLENSYSVERLREQIKDVFSMAKKLKYQEFK
ncbi:hypothetical protein OAO18_08290 [Francisellaceae bacterium]|nr:hypothetical protein [Francisellaceae bacterium]